MIKHTQIIRRLLQYIFEMGIFANSFFTKIDTFFVMFFSRDNWISDRNYFHHTYQLTFTCSKSRIETLENGVKHVQS